MRVIDDQSIDSIIYVFFLFQVVIYIYIYIDNIIYVYIIVNIYLHDHT